MLTVGSLFTGIGGFDLGLERAGMSVEWQCERDEFCRRVLARRWPHIPCHPDVRKLRGHAVPGVDVLCGGFPCQDTSSIGLRAGIDGARSGLWAEFARLVGELRPRYVIVENVAGLRVRGLDRVVGDLAARRYDAEWGCIRASDVGAPHRRDRIWIVAYPSWDLLAEQEACRSERQRTGAGGQPGGAGGGPSRWAAEPGVCRVADGIPDRVDRLRALNNALVPDIAEWIGRRIVSYEESA